MTDYLRAGFRENRGRRGGQKHIDEQRRTDAVDWRRDGRPGRRRGGRGSGFKPGTTGRNQFRSRSVRRFPWGTLGCCQGCGNHDRLCEGGEAEQGQRAENAGLESPQLVRGAQCLLDETEYSDGLFYTPERSTFISLARIEAYNAMIRV